MITFPEELKPLISLGYTFTSDDSPLGSQIDGVVVEAERRFKYGLVNFQINLSLDAEKMAIFKQFYDVEIFKGTAKFLMPLDSGNGIEDTPVIITPGSVSYDLGQNPKNRISFSVIAELTEFQNNPYGGTLVDAYEAGANS